MYTKLSRLWEHITTRRRKQLLQLFVLTLIASIVEVISIGAVLPFLGVLTSPEIFFENPISVPVIKFLDLKSPHQLVLPLTALFILGVVISAVMRLLLLCSQAHLGYAIGADLSIEIYRRTLYQPYQVHLTRNSSQVIAGMSSKVNQVVGSCILPLLTAISSGVIFLVVLVALIIIEPWLTLIACGSFGLIYYAITLITKKQLKKNSTTISNNSSGLIKALQEGLGGIRNVLMDNTQSTYFDLYKVSDVAMRHAQANNRILGGAPRFLIEALGMSTLALGGYFVAINGPGFSQAVPILGILALGSQKLLPIMQQLYQSLTSLRGAQASLSDVLELLAQPSPPQLHSTLVNTLKFEYSIKLNSVSFSYNDVNSDILNSVNLEIKKGTSVGLIGLTGSGKSTLLDIFMGLLEPTSGSLEIDGVAITKQNCNAWQAKIAHVPQSFFLADLSVAENIALGIPPSKIDMQRVKAAAEKAQIAKTIESLDKQYDTRVGELGIRLSGGQRQRICIARALYKQANIIVFDEATSALDNETEFALIEAIKTIGHDYTILIVAHRLSALQACDQIYELEKGSIKKLIMTT
jgi:ABC-type multidrug transport system fused ATPase/permease subunit